LSYIGTNVMFLLVPAYPGCPGQTAVKWLLLCCCRYKRFYNENMTKTKKSFKKLHLCCTVDQWIKAQHNSSQLDTRVDHISVSDSKKLQQNKRRQHQKTCTSGHLWPALTSSVVCPMMECCCVDDTSLEHAIAGLSPGWVDPDVDWLYIRISLPQPGGMWVHKVSSNDWAVRVTPQWPNDDPV